MTATFARGMKRRSVRLALAGAGLLAAVHGAAADDAGIHQFFSAIFGGEAQPSPSAAAPMEGQSVPDVRDDRIMRHHRARPLTVRLHPNKPRIVAAQGPFKPVKVSIFEDRTLQPGDAVMTAHGIRIFAGSEAWPYASSDFVSLDDAKNVNKGVARTFAALDRLPRG